MSRLIVLSNRCASTTEKITDPLLAAIAQIFKKYPGIWFGWDGEINTSKRRPGGQDEIREGVTVHSWPLSPNEYNNFYQGYIHHVLWPVFHSRPDLAAYKKEYFITWKSYIQDRLQQITRYIDNDDLIWVHDYHLLPAGKMLKEEGYRNRCGFFLHQPFPPGDMFRAIPEHDWIMRGFFSYDLIGFQSSADMNNFIAYVLRFYRAVRVGENCLKINGQTMLLRILPCGINKETLNDSPATLPAVQDYHRPIIISNDAISDISGIHYRLDAMRTFLNAHPQYIRDVSLLQISDPSREYPHSSPDLQARLERFCGEINGQYGDFSWYPVNYIHNSLCHQDLIYALYTKARVAMFTPLSEGMSLSAKEFILAQNPANPGVLILSEFTGAAEQLSEAIVINPYDASETSEAIHSALSMSLHERKRRHSKLLEKVNRYDCLWWGREFVTSLTEVPSEAAQNAFRTSHYGLYAPHKLY